MIEKKFWKPAVTSQFDICPIPFHLDTYRGCMYNCTYCFARDFVTFSRRNAEQKGFTYLVGNRSNLFEKWIERTLSKEYDYSKAEEVAFKERIPLKIGATADPFPTVEAKERITYGFLKTLEQLDYPVEIQTKNPEILASYVDEFRQKDPNWIIAVTLISTDEDFLKVCEPNAPSAIDRLYAMKKLTDSGIKVMVKIQPAIFPKIIEDLPTLIECIKVAGCWSFNVEGLKVRISMPKEEQELFQTIGNYCQYDIRHYYKKEGNMTGSDWELNIYNKQKYADLAWELAEKYGLKFFSADNDLGCQGWGDGLECCGTEVLKNYKIWGNSLRSKAFEKTGYESTEFGKCLVTFCRSKKNAGKTIDEVIEAKFRTLEEDRQQKELFSKEEGSSFLVHKAYPGKDRIYKEISPTISTPSGGGHLPYVKEAKAVLTPDRKKKRQEGRPIKENEEPMFTLTGQDVHGIQQSQRIRRLTPIECERLQGFPDDWTEGVSDSQRYKMMGNAVSVPVIQAIGRKILKRVT